MSHHDNPAQVVKPTDFKGVVHFQTKLVRKQAVNYRNHGVANLIFQNDFSYTAPRGTFLKAD